LFETRPRRDLARFSRDRDETETIKIKSRGRLEAETSRPRLHSCALRLELGLLDSRKVSNRTFQFTTRRRACRQSCTWVGLLAEIWRLGVRDVDRVS